MLERTCTSSAYIGRIHETFEEFSRTEFLIFVEIWDEIFSLGLLETYLTLIGLLDVSSDVSSEQGGAERLLCEVDDDERAKVQKINKQNNKEQMKDFKRSLMFFRWLIRD